MAKSELSPRVVSKFRKILGAYHTEAEELVRVLQALEAAGLRTYSIRRLERMHYQLEKYLEALDAGEFGAQEVARIVSQLENQGLAPFGPDGAFERATGRAVAQMGKVEKHWTQLHEFVFALPETEVPILELETGAGGEDEE